MLLLGHRRVKKPLDLLRALVAAGPQGATREELCESVWELPSHAAYRSLVTNVFRLRRLLGDPTAIAFVDRRVALDSDRCRIDAWDFEAELQAQAHFGPRTLAALSLYRGALFEGHFAPNLAAMRERCCRLFVSATLQAGSELVAARQLAAAQLHYEKALQVECSVEELFRALIEVLGLRGRSAAATIAYNSCAVAMRRYHGRVPSPATRLAWEAAVGSGTAVSPVPDQPYQVLPAGVSRGSSQGAQPSYA
jgi:DNA-binding SARP family transcriptional activator